MNLIKDKRGLNSSGHQAFSIILYIIIYLVLQSYFKLDVKVFIFGLCPYILGALASDWVENSKMGPKHRGFWHSYQFMAIIIFIIIPLCVLQFYITHSNNFILLAFFFYGILSHFLPDALTKSSLPLK